MMINWSIVIICAVGISILLSFVVIPQILHVSMVKKLFDRPNARKIHSGAVPRLGGFAFLPVIILTLGIMLVTPSFYSSNTPIWENPDFIRFVPDVMVLLGAGMVMFLVGLYDDLLGLKYSVKFVAQIVAAVMLVEAGDFILDYENLFGIGVTTVAMGKIISGFIIVYVVNALNLIDGIDGLASGMCVIALALYGMALFDENRYFFSLVSWVTCGTVGVFWLFNVFGSKRRHTKIFMGDIGSLSIGVIIAFLLIAVANQKEECCSWGQQAMVIAFSPLVIPLFDVVRVFGIRLISGKSPFLPDKRHIHHLMLAAGMPMSMVMVLLIIAQIVIIFINLWLASSLEINIILIIDVVIFALGACLLTMARKDAPTHKKIKSTR